MPLFPSVFIFLACVVSFGSSLECHTCASEYEHGECRYGDTHATNIKDCPEGQDRCFKGTFRKGDYIEFRRGCGTQDYCQQERKKENDNYEVIRCSVCEQRECNSGTLTY